MLKVEKVSKSYHTKYYDHRALNDVTYQFPDCGMVFVVGKSGSGKSTLLNLMGGLDNSSEGSIYFNDVLLEFKKETSLDDFRKNEIGFIFQKFNLISYLNVYQNIAIAKQMQGKIVTESEVKALLEVVDMQDYSNRLVAYLSVGQQQRVAIARALIKDANIILADEPTSNLDTENTKIIFDILKDISKSRLVIIATHDLESAEIYADEILHLEDSHLIKSEKRHQVIKEPLKQQQASQKMSSWSVFKLFRKLLRGKALYTFLTLILSFLAITFFMISFTAISVDEEKVMLDVLKQQEVSYLTLKHISPNDFIKPYTGDAFSARYVNVEKVYQSSNDRLFAKYITEIDDFDKTTFDFINGKKPMNYDEVVISYDIAQEIIDKQFTQGYVMSDLIGQRVHTLIRGNTSDLNLKITGIIRTDLENQSINPLSILKQSLYVNKGFHSYYMNQSNAVGGSLRLVFAGKAVYKYDIGSGTTGSEIIKKSKADHESSLKVYTQSGIKQLNELTLSKHEVLINLYQYNQLFRTRETDIHDDDILNHTLELGQTIQFNYSDNLFIDLTQELNVKGILLDPRINGIDKIEQPSGLDLPVAAHVMISDDFFNEIIAQYDKPHSYLYQLHRGNDYQFFKNIHDDEDIYIEAGTGVYLSGLASTASENMPLLLTSATLAVLVMLIVYHNTSTRIKTSQKEISVLRSLGMKRKTIFLSFIYENLAMSAWILAISFTLTQLFMIYVNTAASTDEIKRTILQFNFFNVSVSILFTVTTLLLSMMIPLYRLLKKSPVEMIRLS